MLNIVIGNRAYSSWSMRGWLAVRLSGLPFTETLLPMWSPEWDAARATGPLALSGKVPTLIDGDVTLWDSLAIVEHLAEHTGRDRFWPADPAARARARSIAAEMHSGYPDLRRDCGMNVRRRYAPSPLAPATQGDVDRVVALWTEARTRFGTGGDYLFGDYGAADLMFAPVATRFRTYAVPLPAIADRYVDALLAHPHVAEWIAAAHAEPWVLDRYER
ncbi:glutathione S-transferase [Sphingomonas montana]|uniref:glutathione S-transferase n=1 Tax=Sphingomonas montana TaxID=1843236 RepID=UPI00096E3877|nr:glutathione S-transferase [Sphingomonas montana]